MRWSLDSRFPIGESVATQLPCEDEPTSSTRIHPPLPCSQSSHLDALQAILLHANSPCPCTASQLPHTRQRCLYQSPFFAGHLFHRHSHVEVHLRLAHFALLHFQQYQCQRSLLPGAVFFGRK